MLTLPLTSAHAHTCGHTPWNHLRLTWKYNLTKKHLTSWFLKLMPKPWNCQKAGRCRGPSTKRGTVNIELFRQGSVVHRTGPPVLSSINSRVPHLRGWIKSFNLSALRSICEGLGVVSCTLLFSCKDWAATNGSQVCPLSLPFLLCTETLHVSGQHSPRFSTA